LQKNHLIIQQIYSKNLKKMLVKVAEKKLRKGRRRSSSTQSHLKDTRLTQTFQIKMTNYLAIYQTSTEIRLKMLRWKITKSLNTFWSAGASERLPRKLRSKITDLNPLILTLKDDNKKYIQHLIKTGSTEEFLEIYTDEVKGRGIRALKAFRKGEFVVEYKGLIFIYSLN
jgi:hypothetical protein